MTADTEAGAITIEPTAIDGGRPRRFLIADGGHPSNSAENPFIRRARRTRRVRCGKCARCRVRGAPRLWWGCGGCWTPPRALGLLEEGGEAALGLGDGGLGTAAATLIGNQRMMNLVGWSVGVGGDQPLGTEFHELPAEATDTDPESLPRFQDGLLVDAVSDIHVQYGSLDNPTTEYGEQPDIEREPDARIEMYPYNIDSLCEFQIRVANHLVCQVRDVIS